MEIKKLKLKNKLGMHARAAAAFFKVAEKFKAEIYLEYQGETVSGKSILSILTLACPYGGELTVKADGVDAGGAIKALENLIENKFGED
ncbi:MAG: phosphocarrier protein HPr [Deltaproteobacteria bacterium RBG_19FT_COMBO_43_11]|nr:MAG: phosphocarrier protein HPr [Deltaproteobacteria bacterium RBG_19FT_COMBO_43_11]